MNDHIDSNEGYIWNLKGLLISFNLNSACYKKDVFQDCVEFFKKAIEFGCYGALYNLGYCCEVMGELDTAIKYYKLASDHNDCNAMINLGYMYYHTDRHDLLESTKYFQKASDLGNIEATEFLGDIYYTDHQDNDNAIKYYQIALHLGSVRAMVGLGNVYHHKHDDDDTNAIKYYQMAIGHNNYTCSCELGDLYKSCGKYVKALKCYCLGNKHYGWSDTIIEQICNIINTIIDHEHPVSKQNTNINNILSYLNNRGDPNLLAGSCVIYCMIGKVDKCIKLYAKLKQNKPNDEIWDKVCNYLTEHLHMIRVLDYIAEGY